MNFGAPLGLLVLAAVPALVAAYFLRRRQPPRVVSALFLWRSPEVRAEAGPRLQRFSREASLALEVLAVVAAAVFLSDARCGPAAPGPHLVVVVDGSLSMAASRDGRTSAQRAAEAVASLAGRERAGTMTVVASGPRPRLLAGPAAEVPRALAALSAFRPSQPAHALSPALRFADEVSGAGGGRVYVFTDGPVTEALPPSAEGLSVGLSLDNDAFLSAEREDSEGAARVTVRVGHFGARAARVPVRFAAKDMEPRVEVLDLEPGASAAVRVSLATRAPVAVTLPDDALVDDGRLTLPPAPREDVTVAFLDGLDAAALSGMRRFIGASSGVREGTPGQLVVGPPGTAAQVTLGAVGERRAFVGPFFAQRADARLDDVELGGVVWVAGDNPPGRALLAAGQTVLMSEDDEGHTHLNLDVATSSVQRTAAWPVLWGNLVRRARLEAPGFSRRQVGLGEDVVAVVAPGKRWQLRGPTDEVVALLGVGALTLPPLSPPGRWRLQADGEDVDAVEVLPIDPQESDLRPLGPWEAHASVVRPVVAAAPTRPLWPLAVLLLLVLVDLWVTTSAPVAPRREEAAG